MAERGLKEFEIISCMDSDFEDDLDFDIEDEVEKVMDGKTTLDSITGIDEILPPSTNQYLADEEEAIILLFEENHSECEITENSVPDPDVNTSNLIVEETTSQVNEPGPSTTQAKNGFTPETTTRKTIPKRRYQWRKKDFVNKDTTWSGALPDPPLEHYTPLQYFKMFISDNIVKHIAVETNKYAHEKEGVILEVSDDEIEQYFGILLHMGIVSMAQYRMYWSNDCRYAPIADILSRNRFDQLRKFFHICDNTEQKKDTSDPQFDKLFKVRPLIEEFKKKCNKIPPEEKHSIDEQIIPFKGRSHLKQYVKGKPHKWGFKCFTRAGASGLMYDFSIYVGKGTCPDKGLGFSGDIVLNLVEQLPSNMNFKIYFDNWFSSIHLVEELEKKKFWCVGTIRSDRMAKCSLMSEKEMKQIGRGSIDWKVSDSDIILVRWLDSKPIQFVSNYCGTEPTDMCQRFSKTTRKIVDIPRPMVVREYNQFMGGVDLADMLIELYRIDVRSKKWYMRIVYWCLNAAVVNAWLLYRRHQKQWNEKKEFSLLQFQARIATALTSANKITNRKRGRPSSTESIKKKKFNPKTANI